MTDLDLTLDIPGAPINARSFSPQIPTARRSTPPIEAQGKSGSAGALLDDRRVRDRVRSVFERMNRADTFVVPVNAEMGGEAMGPAVAILGRVTGTVVSAGPVYVKAGAAVLGTVTSKDIVVVSGLVKTSLNEVAIHSDGWVVLGRSAWVVGHIKCGSVFIFDGARVDGTIQSNDE